MAFTQSRIQTIIGHYLAGETPAQVAALNNCSLASVYRLLHLHNIPLRPSKRGRKTRMEYAYLPSMRAEGKSVAECARTFGVSRQRIYQILERMTTR